MIHLAAFDPNAAGFSALLSESQTEGHGMLLRLAENWENRSNLFSRPGEVIYGAYAGDIIVGTCGRNIDPYDLRPRAGRVRHLYVAQHARGNGVGRLLVSAIVADAVDFFDYLNTNAPPNAFAFYETLGFVPVEGSNVTHRLMLL